MTVYVEISDDLQERMETHLEEGQTYEELIEELVTIYENSRFLQEGYSE